MKNAFVIIVSAVVSAVLLCCSCQENNYIETPVLVDASPDEFVRSICFSVDAFDTEDGAITSKSTYDASGNFYFDATDTVGVFPAKGNQVYFEIEGEYVGKRSVEFDGGGWALKDSYSYWSYYPIVGDFYLDKTYIPVEYFDLTQDGNGGINHISPLDFLYTDQCKVVNGELSFRYHHLNSILRPRVTLPAGTYSKIVIQAESDVFVLRGYYDLTADTPAITGTDFSDHLTLNLENASFSTETAFVGNLITAPVDISNMPLKVIIFSGDSPKYYYTYQRSSALNAGIPYGLVCSELKYADQQDRGLSFNPKNVTCTLGSIPEKPVLSGEYTNVAFSSSDDTIAKVDSVGNVTPISAGTVTITATAEEDDIYLQGSASYTLTVLNTYTKAFSVIVGGTYIITSVADDKVFKGSVDGSSESVSPSNSVITDTKNSLSAYEFTLEDNGGNFYLKNVEGKYLICDYSNSGNSTSGIRYVDAREKVVYPFTLTCNNGAFFFNTSRTDNGDANQYLYFKTSGTNSNIFKIGGSGSSVGVHLYLKTGSSGSPAKKAQTLEFADQTITWTLGDEYVIGQSYAFPQYVRGALTTVTYSSEPEDVVKIEGGKMKIVGAGSATITAKAAESDEYYSGAATFSLRIIKPASEEWVNLGSFTLENKAVQDYLDDAIKSYSDTDDATKTVMATYANGAAYSSIDRKDCPNPVKITWNNSASDDTVISIYEEKTLTKPVWTQNATAKSTSADVYNLIPERTYYYTVSEGSVVWEKGYFNTTGRRRLIKVSNVEKKGHANNCRDLGGLEVTDKGVKKTIKYGYIFRGTNMDKTTPDEKSILVDFLNIGMDVDLRNGSTSGNMLSDDGSSSRYQPFTSPYNVGYVSPGFNSFADLTDKAKIYSVVMAVFNTAELDKASYIHCYIGADRTGYIIMLLEGLLGVSEKDCSIDYELTSFSEAAELRYRNGQPRDYYFRQGIDFLRGQNGDTFQDKIENYLVNTVGILQDDINRFKSRVLE